MTLPKRPMALSTTVIVDPSPNLCLSEIKFARTDDEGRQEMA
jgi:hypothetical protein